ncbi:hypothetical protein U9M48_025625 [Paspalum notatum var. saurae]|uniref:Uncharacterized protein n=1 Tax=Paspalum notatum var. saurae TaxID=547442 RepID=A0AAQ3WXJ1_PASNO
MSSREAGSRWPELAALRALARDAAQQLQLPQRSGGGGVPAAAARRGREDAHAGGKRDKVMHLLLWGPK